MKTTIILVSLMLSGQLFSQDGAGRKTGVKKETIQHNVEDAKEYIEQKVEAEQKIKEITTVKNVKAKGRGEEAKQVAADKLNAEAEKAKNKLDKTEKGNSAEHRQDIVDVQERGNSAEHRQNLVAPTSDDEAKEQISIRKEETKQGLSSADDKVTLAKSKLEALKESKLITNEAYSEKMERLNEIIMKKDTLKEKVLQK